jgi:hypothetical protein
VRGVVVGLEAGGGEGGEAGRAAAVHGGCWCVDVCVCVCMCCVVLMRDERR